MYILLVRFLLCLKYSALVSVVALFGTSWVMTYSICSGSASCLRGLALPLAASPPPRPPLVRTPEAGLLLVAAPLVRWLEDQMKVRRRICLHSSSHIFYGLGLLWRLTSSIFLNQTWNPQPLNTELLRSFHCTYDGVAAGWVVDYI